MVQNFGPESSLLSIPVIFNRMNRRMGDQNCTTEFLCIFPPSAKTENLIKTPLLVKCSPNPPPPGTVPDIHHHFHIPTPPPPLQKYQMFLDLVEVVDGAEWELSVAGLANMSRGLQSNKYQINFQQC